MDEISFSELSERLDGPDGVQVAESTLRRIEELQAELASNIAAGLPPDDYEKATKVQKALAAARDIVLLAVRARASGADAADGS